MTVKRKTKLTEALAGRDYYKAELDKYFKLYTTSLGEVDALKLELSAVQRQLEQTRILYTRFNQS